MVIRRFIFAFIVFMIIAAPVFSKERVAVLDFEAKDVPESDAMSVSDLFRSDLVVVGAYTVLERGNMQSILSEHQLQMKGITDEASASEIGKLLSVNYLFLGNLSKFGSNFILVIDKINVETGEIENSVKKSAVKIDDLLVLSSEAAAEMSEGAGFTENGSDRLYNAETLTQLIAEINIYHLLELSVLEVNTAEMQATDIDLRRQIYNSRKLDNSVLCMIVNAFTFGIGGNFMQGFNEYGYISIGTTAAFAASLLFSDNTTLKIVTGSLWAVTYGGSILSPFIYEVDYNQYLKDSLLVY